MNGSSTDLAGILNRCQTGIAAIFQQTTARSQQAVAIARLLSELLPEASLAGCLFHGEGNASLTVRPKNAVPIAEFERFFQSQLSSLDLRTSGVYRMPAEIAPGLQVLAATIHEEQWARGFLLMGLTGDAAEEARARAEALLIVAAPAVALHGALESLRREQAELARFALVGQAFTGLAHDLNNALNSMMLQTSVVQLKVDQQARSDLAAIRQHGAQAAGLVRSLQHVVQERREKFYAVDVHSVLTEVLEAAPELRRRVASQPAESVPPIQSTHSAVKQFVRLLLEGVCAGTKAAVSVAIGVREGGVALSLTIAAVPPDVGAEGGPPAAEALLWRNLDEVGRQAGQSLLRQLGGVLSLERSSESEVVLHVVWTPSA
jgi:signal transduction histidine kinase